MDFLYEILLYCPIFGTIGTNGFTIDLSL